MSAIAIIVIAVVVVGIVLALLLVMPQLRARGRAQTRERELRRRREQVAAQERQEAETRARRAEQAERRSRIAEQEAKRQRAEAQLREERAALHERGMADHELVDDDEAERFAGTAAARHDPGAFERDSRETTAYQEGRRSIDDPSRAEDFRRGRAQAGARDEHGLVGRVRRGTSREPGERP